MKPSKNKPRRPSPAASKARQAAASAAPDRAPFSVRLATFLLWLLILVPPFVFYPVAKESFRQPKLLVSGWLALASLIPLAVGLWRMEAVRFSRLWRSKALQAVLPLAAVASFGLLTTRHPLHVEEGLKDFWIGTVCLVGWSLALSADRLQRLLAGLLIPATLLGAIGILQSTGIWQPLAFLGIDPGSRLAMTSTAGNPGDLGAYLVLPCLLGQWLLLKALRTQDPPGPGVLAAGGPLAVCLAALVLSQTLAALAALAAGSLLFWALVLPRRRALLAGAGLAAAAVVLVLAVAPLRERVATKARQAMAGDWNAVLTNRLDGWRTAVRMLEKNPLTGVGHGAYRPEFVPAKLSLLSRGAGFSPDLEQEVVFANAHNEYLEAAAEWGIPGLLALAWALGVLAYALRRGAPPPGDRALAWAGVAALAVLALAHFPFRIALVAFPALLFLSWVMRRSAPEEEGEVAEGKSLGFILTAWLGMALAMQTVRWSDRMEASRRLRQAELVTMAAAVRGEVSPPLLARNLESLRVAAAKDPLEVGIPIALGTQYLLLSRFDRAAEEYGRAIELEPRPEGYLNLGRAQWMAGRTDEARLSFATAVRLDPRLESELPRGARSR